MLWLSLSNTFLYFANAPLTNPSIIIDMLKDLSHKFQTSAVYAFDIFFVIFGFTLAFTTLPKLKISVVKPLSSQILRVVPVYYFVLFFYITAFSRMGLGPAWPLQDYYSSETCENYWTANLFFLNNFLPVSNYSCMGWSWFFAIQAQFFLFGLIALFLHER